MKFSPKEAAGEWWCLLWALSSLSGVFLSSEFYFNCASPAWSCFLGIQLHHFYLGADPRPLLQFVRWMGLYLQRHCWRVRSIIVTSGSNYSSKQWSDIISEVYTEWHNVLNTRSRLASDVFYLLQWAPESSN